MHLPISDGFLKMCWQGITPKKYDSGEAEGVKPLVEMKWGKSLSRRSRTPTQKCGKDSRQKVIDLSNHTLAHGFRRKLRHLFRGQRGFGNLTRDWDIREHRQTVTNKSRCLKLRTQIWKLPSRRRQIGKESRNENTNGGRVGKIEWNNFSVEAKSIFYLINHLDSY